MRSRSPFSHRLHRRWGSPIGLVPTPSLSGAKIAKGPIQYQRMSSLRSRLPVSAETRIPITTIDPSRPPQVVPHAAPRMSKTQILVPRNRPTARNGGNDASRLSAAVPGASRTVASGASQDGSRPLRILGAAPTVANVTALAQEDDRAPRSSRWCMTSVKGRRMSPVERAGCRFASRIAAVALVIRSPNSD